MADKSPKANPQSDAAFRKFSYEYLRVSQRFLNELKGRVADKDIVTRYGDQGGEEEDCDPDTPTDMTAIMSDLEDILKQISIYSDKLRGKEHCSSFRDSGYSMCSDRSSFADDAILSNAIQNAENHDIPSYLAQHGEVARNSRARSRLNVDGDRMDIAE